MLSAANESTLTLVLLNPDIPSVDPDHLASEEAN